MNLRPEGDKKNFPPRDQIPAQILTEELHTTAADYEIRCCAFFTAIFIVLRVDLLKLLEQDPSNFDQAICLWNTAMHVDSPQICNKYFQRVDAEYKKVCRGRDTENMLMMVVTVRIYGCYVANSQD